MVAILLATLMTSFGEVSVTNHAGKVVKGELNAVTRESFVISGKTYPLTVLPKAEQLRLKKLAGEDTRSFKEKRAAQRLEYELKRIDARQKEGEITLEEAERLKSDARHSCWKVKP